MHGRSTEDLEKRLKIRSYGRLYGSSCYYDDGHYEIEMGLGPCKKHRFNIIWYESSLGSDYEMDSEPCKKYDFYLILNESSLGNDNEMDSGLCKKTQFYHNSV